MIKSNFRKKIVVLDGCTGCAYCYLICPNDAIKVSGKASINMKLCTLCEKCLYVCPKDAIRISDIKFTSEVNDGTAWDKLRTKYDAIIIGSGIGGLLIGACLSRMGKEVIILEKLAFVGGRFSSIPYKGFQITTGAVHMIPYGSQGPAGKILTNIGCKIHNSNVPASLYVNNKQYIIPKMFNLLSLLSSLGKIDFVKLFINMKRTKFLDSSFSFYDWLKEQTTYQKIFDLFEAFSKFGLSISIKDISYNEMRRVVKNFRRFPVPGVPEGGCGGVTSKLKTVIEAHNGVIKTKAEAAEILIKDGKVHGVIVRDRQDGQKHLLESKVIISDNGPRDTMSLVKENMFDSDVMEKIKRIKEAKGLKIHFSSNKSLISHSGIMFCLDTERVAGIVQPTNADPSLAPAGKHLLIAYHVLKCDNINKEAEIALNDLRRIFGKDFEDHCEVLCISSFEDNWPTNRATQGTDLSFKTPIHGLYMVGDGCKSAGYVMVEGIAKNVENLLKELGYSLDFNNSGSGVADEIRS